MHSNEQEAPIVRLAHVHGAQGTYTLIPTVRLAATGAMIHLDHGQKARYPHHKEREDKGKLLAPALLVSYVYVEPFLENQHRYQYRDWVMDSGAFSAKQLGIEIKLDDYIQKCHELLRKDEKLTEVYALDVIGNEKAGLENAREMVRQGLSAIPCYHHGEPESALRVITEEFPKIALGGAVGLKGDYKIKWAAQCFARVWPKKIHGFGFGTERQIMALPWHSVDATNWEVGPCKYGRWLKYGKMSVRGSRQNLRSEVEHYLDIEHRAQIKWRRQMELLKELEKKPSLGLAVSDSRIGRENNPTLRLAAQQGSQVQIKRSGLD